MNPRPAAIKFLNDPYYRKKGNHERLCVYFYEPKNTYIYACPIFQQSSLANIFIFQIFPKIIYIITRNLPGFICSPNGREI